MNWLARYSSFSRYSYSVLSLGMVRHCSSSASSDLHHVKKDHCVVSMFCVMHRRLLYIHCLSSEVLSVVSVLKPLKQVYTNMPCVQPFICPGMRSLSCMNLSDINCVSDVLI